MSTQGWGLITDPVATPGAVVTNPFRLGDTSSSSATNQSSLTYAHDVSGTDKVLVVTIQHRGSSVRTVSSVTYNGDPLTQKGVCVNANGNEKAEIWGLINPDDGTNNIVITMSGAANIGSSAITFVGADQDFPFGSPASNIGENETPTGAVLSAAERFVVDSVVRVTNAPGTVGTGQTQLSNFTLSSSGISIFAGSSYKMGAGTSVMTWTTGADYWAHCALDVAAKGHTGGNEGGGGGGGDPGDPGGGGGGSGGGIPPTPQPGATTAEIPTEVFGAMVWMDPNFTSFDPLWAQMQAGGADGVLLTNGFIDFISSDDWRKTLPARYSPSPMFFGRYACNFYNYWTMFARWEDDPGWVTMSNMWANNANFAYVNNYKGIIMDMEPYPVPHPDVPGLVVANPGAWAWDYTHSGTNPFGLTESFVRNAAEERGAQLMTAIVAAFPNVKIATYFNIFKDGWRDKVYQANGGPATGPSSVEWAVVKEFWQGMTSVDGWKEITFLDESMYKDPQFPGATWDMALGYAVQWFRGFVNTNFTHPERCRWAPFSNINNDGSPYGYYRGSSWVIQQWNKFAQYVVDASNRGTMCADYVFNDLRDGFPLDAIPAFGRFSRRLGTAPSTYT